MNLLAVIIKGNPKYLENTIGKRYYNDIKSYIEKKGITVEFDSGEDFTIPRIDADFYIGHSRGASRYNFMPEECKKVFLKFGTIDGITHPVDLKWLKEGGDGSPPDEHFLFTIEQRKAIDKLIKDILNKKISIENIYLSENSSRSILEDW